MYALINVRRQPWYAGHILIHGACVTHDPFHALADRTCTVVALPSFSRPLRPILRPPIPLPRVPGLEQRISQLLTNGGVNFLFGPGACELSMSAHEKVHRVAQHMG